MTCRHKPRQMTINQLDVYSVLRSLETRTRALYGLIESAKRCCIHGGDGSMPELVTLASELRWQLRQLDQSVVRMQVGLGVNSNADQAKPDQGRNKAAGRETLTLRGNTSVISMADLVGMLSSLGKTGTLALESADAVYVFELQEGRIVHAVTNQSDAGMRLGTILIAQSKISEQQLEESLAESKALHHLLGDVLVRSATVSQQDLRSALDQQVRWIFERAFGLRQAEFTFLEGCVSKLRMRTSINTTELLLEAARQMDERRGDRSRADVASPDDPTSVLDSILKG